MDQPIFGLSNHGAIRSQQRGIPMTAVEILQEYGKPRHTRGGISYSMDKRSRLWARGELGESQYRGIEKWLKCYVITSLEDTVITESFRTRRFRCD